MPYENYIPHDFDLHEIDESKIKNDLSKYEGDDKVISSIELYEKQKLSSGNKLYFKTKFPTLEELIDGFCGGELTVVSGITKNGKTLWCQTLTNDFSESNIHSLWFTYEVPMMQFLEQFGHNIPHFYMPSILKSRTLEWIYERIREAVEKFNIKVVFIDHLHFLADIMMRGNPSLAIGQVMRTLKGWALELNIVIFIVCHTMKIKHDRELESGDTRDSSFIEQEADNVFYIWRDNKRVDNGAVLKITANRRKGVMDKKIYLMKQGNFLVELTDKKIPSIEDIGDIDDDDFGME